MQPPPRETRYIKSRFFLLNYKYNSLPRGYSICKVVCGRTMPYQFLCGDYQAYIFWRFHVHENSFRNTNQKHNAMISDSKGFPNPGLLVHEVLKNTRFLIHYVPRTYDQQGSKKHDYKFTIKIRNH